MRSAFPIPGNPWPHDMAIRIEDEPHQLLELLWVREVYRFEPGGDVPPPLNDGPAAFRSIADPAVNSGAWSRLWAEVLHHIATLDPGPLLERLHSIAGGSPERAAALGRLIGPNWRDRFGDEAFDEHYQAWQNRRFEQRRSAYPVPPDEQPERRALDDLIPAWRAGLTLVITIPCTGDFTRIAGPAALLVTDATRTDPDRYAAALRTFAAGS